MSAAEHEGFDRSSTEERAESQRREEGKDEAARRLRVKWHLGNWQRIHDDLEPESLEAETDECDATIRIEEGDTFETAMEREVRRVLHEPKPNLTARSVALRIANAYDEEYAYPLESLPGDAVSAERVYAHILSYELLERSLTGPSLRSIARRATVLLLNRRFLSKTAKTPAEVSPRPPQSAAPKSQDLAPEPELCLECGRDVSAPGPGCESCEKTVS